MSTLHIAPETNVASNPTIVDPFTEAGEIHAALAPFTKSIPPLTGNTPTCCEMCGWPRKRSDEECYDHCSTCKQDSDHCWCCPECYSYPCECVPRSTWHGKSTYCEYNCKPQECGCCCSCEGECEDCNHDSTGSGKMAPPWQEKLPTFNYNAASSIYDCVQDAWPNMRCDENDPIEMACDFYLLSAMTSGILNTQHECNGRCRHQFRELLRMEPHWMGPFHEAANQFREHVANCDASFVDYIDMAVGGELRHHKSLRSKYLPSDRSEAWITWKSLRLKLGVDALWGAGVMFRDFNNGDYGGYGGPLWAGAAELLANRLQHKIPVETFVDQTFSLVHNGGVFLNKQAWNMRHGVALDGLQKKILPAQARDDFGYLHRYASPTVRRLWRECWVSVNRVRVRNGIRPTLVPGPQLRRQVMFCRQCNYRTEFGHFGWGCQYEPQVTLIDEEDVEGCTYSTPHEAPVWSPDLKTFYLYENVPWTNTGLVYVGVETINHFGTVADFLYEKREFGPGIYYIANGSRIVYRLKTFVEPAKTSLAEILTAQGIKWEILQHGNKPNFTKEV